MKLNVKSKAVETYGTKVNTIGRIFKKNKKSSLSSYNFCISNLILLLEMINLVNTTGKICEIKEKGNLHLNSYNSCPTPILVLEMTNLVNMIGKIYVPFREKGISL